MKTPPAATPARAASKTHPAPPPRRETPREPGPFSRLMQGALGRPGERPAHGTGPRPDESAQGHGRLRLHDDRMPPVDPREGREGRGDGGRGGEQPDRDLLAPFTPPPPALIAPPSISTPAATPPPGTAAERAEMAALVDRLVTSMRVGRVGKAGHEVHLRLTSDIEVRLRHDRGTLEAELRAPAGSREEADRLAAAFTAEMERRGVVLGAVRVS